MSVDREHGDFDLCPHCGSDQLSDGGPYRRTFMIEIGGLYDGGLFYECPDCQGRWHRWPPGHRLRERAEPYVARRPLP